MDFFLIYIVFKRTLGSDAGASRRLLLLFGLFCFFVLHKVSRMQLEWCPSSKMLPLEEHDEAEIMNESILPLKGER